MPLSPMTAKIFKIASNTCSVSAVALFSKRASTVLEEHRVDYQAVFEQLSMKSTNPNAGVGFTEDEMCIRDSLSTEQYIMAVDKFLVVQVLHAQIGVYSIVRVDICRLYTSSDKFGPLR